MIHTMSRWLFDAPARLLGRLAWVLGLSIVLAGMSGCAGPTESNRRQPEAARTLPGPSNAARGQDEPARSSQQPPAAAGTAVAPGRVPGLELSRTEALAAHSEPEGSATGEVIERGRASWYGRRFQGRPTASGEPFDMHDLTAAHKTLPFGTKVRVRSVRNGREVVVRINDRGPFVKGRVIDLSQAAMKALGLSARGVVRVELLRE
jgi:rare lipoprotein A